MHKKKKHRVSHLRASHPIPFNFFTGLIFAVAAIVCVALGGLFFRGQWRANRNGRSQSLSIPQENYMLPPGAKVVTKSGKEFDVRTAPAPARAPAPVETAAAPTPVDPFAAPVASAPAAASAASSASTAQTAAAEAAAEPAQSVTQAASAMPTLKPLVRKPWSATFVERSTLQLTKLFPSADTGLTASPAAAREVNSGAAMELPLKGNESFILSKYDVSKIRGWTISRAVWHAKVKRGRARSLGFSTITENWEEGAGGPSNAPPGGATYRWAHFRNKAWRNDQLPAPFFFRGQGSSILSVAGPDKRNSGADEWIKVPIDPAVVQSLVAGSAYGMAISDEKGQFNEPVVIASREDTNDCPFIEVEGGLLDLQPPGQITNLKAYPHPALRRRGSVGVILGWTATGDDGRDGQAFSYDVRYGPAPITFDRALPVSRSLIPLPQPAGDRDQMIIEDLDPDVTYTFFLRAVDEAGQFGPVVTADARTPAALERLAADTPPAQTEATPIDIGAGALSLRVFDESAGPAPTLSAAAFNPAGAARGGSLTSPIWDRASRTLTLSAAQNEAVGFIIGLFRKGAEFPALDVKAGPLQSTKGDLAGKGFQFSRIWYSAAQSARGPSLKGDALLPIHDRLALDTPPNNVNGQTCQGLYADIRIPVQAEPGTYRGNILLKKSDGTEDKLNVVLEVLPLRLPDQPRFAIELIAPASLAMLYRKDAANKDDAVPVEKEYYRLARDHRCELTIIPYQRGGELISGFAPETAGRGLDLVTTSWNGWDDRFSGCFSGAAYLGTEGGDFPLGHMILPIFESWPTPFADGFMCDNDLAKAEGGIRVYGGSSDAIYGCLNNDYWRGCRAAIQQFRDHFNSQGWRATKAHIWLNNGPSAGSGGTTPPPWFLGEPEFRDDFLALESYAQVMMADRPSWPPNGLVFRVNVPDILALGHYGAQLFSLLNVSDTESLNWKTLRERAAMYDETIWLQSPVVPIDDTTLPIETAALRYFLEGADGWSIRETVGKPENWSRTTPQSLLYCGLPLNLDRPLPSIRLKALRRAQQDIDYLLLLQDKMGWTRSQLGDYVRQQVPKLVEAVGPSADDLLQLRTAVQQLLMKK